MGRDKALHSTTDEDNELYCFRYKGGKKEGASAGAINRRERGNAKN